jgi:hypothetical protein
VIDVARGDIDRALLTEAQHAAAAGLYAACTAGFLHWLAPRYGDVRTGLRREHAELRDRARGGGQHARTPGVVADLSLGMKYFLAFAVEVGAITAEERDDLERRCWAALGEAATGHANDADAAEPCNQFLRLLAGILASRRGHIADANGGPPEHAERWGWRRAESEDGWRPQGHRLGWLDGADVFLEPESCYAEAQALAHTQGDSIPITRQTLWKRMKEGNRLASWDRARQRNTVRRTLQGVKDREVLHLPAEAISATEKPSEPSANHVELAGTREKRTVSADGWADGTGHCQGNRPPEPSAQSEGNGVDGRFGRSDTGGDTAGAQATTPPVGTAWSGRIV